MSAQTASYPPVYNTQFAFLSKPPPPTHQKKRALPTPNPNAPLPPPPSTPPPTPPKYLQRRGSNTFASSIAAWAAHVQPGSPAPRSPHRRPSVTSTTTTSSFSRRPSITGGTRPTRRPSLSISHSRAPSGSFIHLIDTPTRTQTHTHTHSTPSVANFDLTGLGYTSVFVHFPKTPSTPSPLLRQYQQTHRAGAPIPPKAGAASGEPLSANPALAHIPIPPVPVPEDTPSRPAKKTGMKRFRSLSILRPKGKGSKNRDAAPASPTKTALSTKSTKSSKPTKSSPPKTPKPKTPKPTPSASAASIANRKRAKYAYVRPPPPLANELAMMQFADGGSLESHAKRVMEAQARAALGSGVGTGAGGGVFVGVGDVYRDGKGGIWWDADEEMEYAHLLEGADKEMKDVDGDVDMEDWEEFGHASGPDAGDPLSPFFASSVQAHHPALQSHIPSANKENHPAPSPTPPTRRSSLSTLDSDLDPTYLLPLPENADPRLLPIDDRALASRRIGGPGMSVLSLPARARRRERHLCKPGFLVDVRAFEAPGSPGRGEIGGAEGGVVEGGSKPRGKARRRPAPLKLASSNQVVVVVRRPSQVAAQLAAESSALSPALSPAPAPALALAAAPAPMALAPLVPSPSPNTLEKTRREFIEDSFEPLVPSPAPSPAPAPAPFPAPAPAYGQMQQRPNLTNPAIGASVLSLATSSKPAAAAAKSRMGVKGFFGLGRKGD